MNTLWRKIVAVLAIIGLVGCGQSKQTQPPSAPAATEALQAVVSFSVLADIVQQIGGERVQVVSLVGVGKNPHAFEPAPNDLKTITQAKLLVVNGLGFEGWLNRATDTAQFKGIKVVATQGVPALESPKTNAPKHGEAGHDHEHDHGQIRSQSNMTNTSTAHMIPMCGYPRRWLPSIMCRTFLQA